MTIGGERYALERPLFVLATQNPIEQEGTYPLPEAQLDRFMLNVRHWLPERGGRARRFSRRPRPATSRWLSAVADGRTDRAARGCWCAKW